LRAGDAEATVDELVVASTSRATTVEACGGRLRVGMVEHFFAALAGSFTYDGIVVDVDGPEMPLLDGGCSAWCEAISELGLSPARPRVRVSRHAVIECGESRYELSPADYVDVGARLVLPEPRWTRDARWEGSPDDFRERVAPARTFALDRDVDRLAELGLCRHVDPASVVVLTQDGAHSAGRPFSLDEPVRHKLLDLIGDLYLSGGPPLGRLRALRPGHEANAQAFRRAREAGVFVAV
jgi:UDP-3-O-[3-hydroxymyristoyl] N-acetylglucosamine deacetylase